MIHQITAKWGPHEHRPELLEFPDTCPLCNHGIKAEIVFAGLTGFLNPDRLQVVYRCPRTECAELFIATYSKSHTDSRSSLYAHERSEPIRSAPAQFPEPIQECSPEFLRLYNSAIAVGALGHNDLEGMGIRKSLEFLIKDFETRQHPQDAEQIAGMQLGQVIETYCGDARLKTTAKRATWLGNDETHYVRRWEGKDIDDLKKAVRLTVNWIESEILTKQLEADMPDPRGSWDDRQD